MFNRFLGCLHHCLQTGQTFKIEKAFPTLAVTSATAAAA
jgi:hypothetical protein